MQTWIGLFRAINVGGRNKLPMAPLKSLLESLRCKSVRTYIQSGNVVFQSASKTEKNLKQRIQDAIEQEFEFRPNLLLLTPEDLRAAIRNNPFPKATAAPKTLHFYFLDSIPRSADMAAMDSLATEEEEFQLEGRVFYLHATAGFARSRLAASAERKLGVAATARNYATVEKIVEMVNEVDS